MGWFPWVIFIDTSRRTDYLLSLIMTFVTGGMTLWLAVATGLGSATGALVVLTLILIGTSWYARLLWMRDRAKIGPTRLPAVKVRTPR